MDSSDTIRIVLVDDHTLFRNGLKSLFSMKSGYRIVAEFSTGKEFTEALTDIDADIVLMDYAMPEMNGDEATRIAVRHNPKLKIICLSMYGDERYYSQMVEAGAKGFLQKDSSIDEVLSAIECVQKGESYFSSALMDTLSASIRQRNESVDTLSERELDVLFGICQGKSTQEIADSLFLSKRTVDTHRANILEKTGCNNTASLVVYALKHHLIEI